MTEAEAIAVARETAGEIAVRIEEETGRVVSAGREFPADG